VLVHCVFGINRSASAIICYLMKYHGMGFDYAKAFTKTRRSITNPIEGFRRQMREWGKQFMARQEWQLPGLGLLEKRKAVQGNKLDRYFVKSKMVKKGGTLEEVEGEERRKRVELELRFEEKMSVGKGVEERVEIGEKEEEKEEEEEYKGHGGSVGKE